LPLIVPVPPHVWPPLAFIVNVFPFRFRVPELSVSTPLIARELLNVIPLVLLIVRLFKAATLDGTDIPAELPPKTRLEEEVVDRFVAVPAIAGPFNVSVLPATEKLPEVSVKVPFIVVEPHKVTPPDRLIVRS